MPQWGPPESLFPPLWSLAHQLVLTRRLPETRIRRDALTVAKVQYHLTAIEPRGTPIQPGSSVVVGVGDEVRFFCHLAVDQCSECRESIEYDPQVLTLLDPSDTRSHGPGSHDLGTQWRLLAARSGESRVRLWARADGNPRLQQIQVIVREPTP